MTVLADEPTREKAAKHKHVPGEEGAWIFILGDMCVFAVFFAVYLVQRSHAPALFAASQEHLNRNLGAINTLNLLLSSVLVVLAVRSMRMPAYRSLAPRFVLGAMFFGACFIVVKIFEYHAKIAHHMTPATDDFFMYYFVLTGLHLLHLTIGMGVLTALWRLSKKPDLSKHQWAFFEAGACFWHMVDLLWLVLFPLLYLAR